MRIERAFGSAIVEVFTDETYTHDSSDNLRSYVREIQAAEGSWPVVGILTKDRTGDEISSAILLGWYPMSTVYDSLFVLSENRLFICACQSLLCLSCPMLELVWRTQVTEGDAFQVFDIGVGLIVHGEVDVCRVGYDGGIKWQRSGPDIFVTPEGHGDFLVVPGRVVAKCWDGTTLAWDFDGNDVPH